MIQQHYDTIVQKMTAVLLNIFLLHLLGEIFLRLHMSYHSIHHQIVQL